MPRKLRELRAELRRAGFAIARVAGSHETWRHPNGQRVVLAGADGANLLRNGDFAQGTQFWFFTDDNHVLWRIFNQYLTSFFEGGMLGALALVLLLSGGMAGALHALARGEREAASLAGALAAFAVSCLFDAPLEAPRLALVFYLVVFSAESARSDEARWIG